MSMTASDVEEVTRPLPVPVDDDGGHDRFSHIVVRSEVPQTTARALCGKILDIPGRDPKKYPLCPTCAEIARVVGFSVPTEGL